MTNKGSSGLGDDSATASGVAQAAADPSRTQAKRAALPPPLSKTGAPARPAISPPLSSTGSSSPAGGAAGATVADGAAPLVTTFKARSGPPPTTMRPVFRGGEPGGAGARLASSPHSAATKITSGSPAVGGGQGALPGARGGGSRPGTPAASAYGGRVPSARRRVIHRPRGPVDFDEDVDEFGRPVFGGGGARKPATRPAAAAVNRGLLGSLFGGMSPQTVTEVTKLGLMGMLCGAAYGAIKSTASDRGLLYDLNPKPKAFDIDPLAGKLFNRLAKYRHLEEFSYRKALEWTDLIFLREREMADSGPTAADFSIVQTLVLGVLTHLMALRNRAPDGPTYFAIGKLKQEIAGILKDHLKNCYDLSAVCRVTSL